MQPYLSESAGWTIGEDYREVAGLGPIQDPDAAINDAGQRAIVVADPVPGTVAQLAYSLVLDAETGTYVYVRPAGGSAGGASAETADAGAALPVKALPDGRYRIEVRDVPAHGLGAMRGIGTTVGGSALEVSVSPLSYVHDVLRSTPGGTEGAVGPGCGGLAPQTLEGDAGLQGRHLTLGAGPR